MGDQRDPILWGLLDAITALFDNDIFTLEEDITTGSRPQKKITWANLKLRLAEALQFISGLVLSPGRIAMQETVEVTIPGVPGWYKVLKLAPASRIGRVDCNIEANGVSKEGIFSFSAGTVQSLTPRPYIKNMPSIYPAVITGIGIDSVKIGFSNSVANAGSFIEVFSNSPNDLEIVLQYFNFARSDQKGWEPITPILSDGLLPDGITNATYIEAGAVLSFEPIGSHLFQDIIGQKNGDDQIRCVGLWPEIPKKGTDLTLNLPSTSLIFRDGVGASGTITGAHSISNFSINGKHIIFFINETGIGTALNAGSAFPLVNGTGMNLTIT